MKPFVVAAIAAGGTAVLAGVRMSPWAGSYYRYAAYDGMMIPLAAEVVWTRSDGPLTVWRGNVTSVSYTYGSNEAVLATPH